MIVQRFVQRIYWCMEELLVLGSQIPEQFNLYIKNIHNVFGYHIE